jgi:hypothetical protein
VHGTRDKLMPVSSLKLLYDIDGRLKDLQARIYLRKELRLDALFGRGKFDVEVSLEFVFNKKRIEFSIFGNILKWLKRRKKFSPKVFENVNDA